MKPEDVKELIEDVGSNVDEMRALPDGSGFAIASFELPKDHWLYAEGFNVPPMPFRRGTDDPDRKLWVKLLRIAARYAIRATTANGRLADFDPDAMVNNFIVGMLGYWTPDGLSEDAWANPPDVLEKRT